MTMEQQGFISVVILTYNEELNVRHALDSVTFSDNVVVVDSFSTDRTESICREYDNVTFVQNPFVNLAEQRQFALDSKYVRHDWVLALDADEIVSPELGSELQKIASCAAESQPVAYDMAMRLIMWGKWLKHSSEYPVYWRRFYRRDKVRYVQRGHADTIDVDGLVGRTQHDLIHHDHKGISDWLAKHNKYSSQEAEYALRELAHVPLKNLFSSDRLLRRRALKRIFRFMPFSSSIRFLYLYVLRMGFLDGAPGYRLCVLRSQQGYHVQLKMREIREAAHYQVLASLKTTETAATAGSFVGETH